MTTSTTDRPEAGVSTDVGLADPHQVILHNDDYHSMEFVVWCLMKVFGHNEQLATKIMYEAHARGRAVAEVESEPRARKHAEQLRSFGLIATVEKVG